tara:strand:+ start:337 stop:522 length:186 start_codon:yes stop_codon:yes gene_type:complete
VLVLPMATLASIDGLLVDGKTADAISVNEQEESNNGRSINIFRITFSFLGDKTQISGYYYM